MTTRGRLGLSQTHQWRRGGRQWPPRGPALRVMTAGRVRGCASMHGGETCGGGGAHPRGSSVRSSSRRRRATPGRRRVDADPAAAASLPRSVCDRETVSRGRLGRGPVLGFSTPWAVARHCRTKMRGAAAPATSAAMARRSATSSSLPRRHVWRGRVVFPRHGNRHDQKC